MKLWRRRRARVSAPAFDYGQWSRQRMVEAQAFAEEMRAWPPPLEMWLALLRGAGPQTQLGRDLVRGPDPRWHEVPPQRHSGRQGRRGGPPIGPYG